MTDKSSFKSKGIISSEAVSYPDMGKRQEGNTLGTEIGKEAALRLHFQPFLSSMGMKSYE